MNFALFIIQSGSMEPSIKIGELIIVQKKNEYFENEIITFYDETSKMYITHRIIKIDENSNFITKGDFNNLVDQNYVSSNCIVGKVIFHSKMLGFIFYKYVKFIIFLFVIIYIMISCKERRDRK